MIFIKYKGTKILNSYTKEVYVIIKSLLLQYKSLIRGLIYFFILLTIVVFLYKSGTKSWVIVTQHLNIVSWLMVIFILALIVQAQGFRYLYPSNLKPIPLGAMIYIWSLSSVMSVIAPFFPGIGVRTALLIKGGQSINLIMSVSLRQVWLGIEYAILAAAIALTGIASFGYPYGVIALLFWCLVYGVRKLAQNYGSLFFKNRFNFLYSNFSINSHVFSVLQLLCMSAIYYLVYSEFGIDFTVFQAIALSSITILLSLVAFAPNGLGLNDLLWVLVATNGGLSIEASVALAILLRISHFISILLVLCVFSIFMNRKNIFNR